MGDFKKKLKDAQAKWKAAKKRVAEGTSQFAEYDDGRYMAKLVEARVEESQSSGRLQAVFGWKFQEGEYEGKIKYAYQGLESEDSMFYFGRDLQTMGYELPDGIDEIEEVLKDAVKSGVLAQIVLKTKGDFQNVYLRKVFNADEDVETEEETETSEEDAEEETTETVEETEEEAEEETDEEEADEEEAAEEEDEGVEIEIGMRVQAETAKGREAGEIIEVLAEEGKVRVKLDTGKVVRVPVDKIEVELEPEEVPEEPPAPPAKKAAPAPAKKAAPAPPVKKGKK